MIYLKNITDEKGMVIISILMVTVVLLIMTTSMLIIHSSTLGFITLYEKQTIARKLAESGVAYALYSLRNDSHWGKIPTDPNFIGTIDVPEVNGQFKITFENSPGKYYSYYNIEEAAKDPNYGYKNSGVPGYSMDLIVEGIANPGPNQVSKKYRVILQADSFYDGALTSGAFNATANSITVKKEDDNDPNIFLPGSIHSNSILGKEDPNTGLPITVGGSNYAIDSNSAASTSFDLYGGVLSTQGDINPLINVDPNQRDPKSRARHMKPVDITGTINDAVASSTIPQFSGATYVVGKNHLVNPGTGADIPNVLGNEPGDYEVIDGKLIIKKDIVFNGGDVRFEFAYDKITEDIDPADTGAIKSAVKNAGIYMGDGTGSSPSVYIDNGNLTVAGGVVKGNGSFYVDGEANYIGESNLVASDEAGVAVLANKDVNLALPSAPTTQEVDMTGLVYSAGNANVKLFDPADMTDPLNNFSASTQWPSTWGFDYEEAVTLSGGGGSGSEPTFAAHAGDRIRTNIAGPPIEYITYEIYGTDDATITNTGTNKWDDNRTTILSANSSTETRLTVYTGPTNSPTGPWTPVYQKILAPGEQIIFDKVNSAGIPGVINTGMFRDGVYSNPLSNDLPGTEALPSIVTTGTKVPPNFKFTGALVAIDPNNPVPSVTKHDDPNAGNININIDGGNLDITCSSRYLKLLRVVKAGTIFRVVSWTEL